MGHYHSPTPPCLSIHVSYSILVHLAYIFLPPHFTLHKSARLTHFATHVQHWVTSIPPPNGPATAYGRMPPSPYCPPTKLAWVGFRSTSTVAKALYQKSPRRSRSTVCPCGMVFIGSQYFSTLVRRCLAWFAFQRVRRRTSLVILISACSTFFNSVPHR